jgi:hypothetical protein
MPHPNGGSGPTFTPKHTFHQAHAYVGAKGVTFRSTTGERITASSRLAKDQSTPTIVFMGERNRHGSVCASCWGFRTDCNGSWIGQCADALDAIIP